MDHEVLLQKYIAFVISEEGIDFLGNIPTNPAMRNEVFSDEEIAELNRLSPYGSR